jgi:hypothetical protein
MQEEFVRLSLRDGADPAGGYPNRVDFRNQTTGEKLFGQQRFDHRFDLFGVLASRADFD